MDLNNNNYEFERPLINYCIGLFMGILCFFTFEVNIIIGVVYTTSYVFIMSRSIKGQLLAFICFLSLIGYILIYSYFSLNLPKENETVIVKLISKSSSYYYSTCLYKDKLISLLGNIDGAEEGDYIDVSGDFKKKIQFEYGTVGEFKVKESKVIKNTSLLNVYSMRSKIFCNLSSAMGEDRAGILMSLCYGDNRYIDIDYKNSLNSLGIVHIISVSGLHMGILFSILNIIPSNLIQCILGFFYVLLTGSKAATYRAFIMIATSKASKKVYKKYDSINALCLSAIIIISIKPYYAFNLGFLLSYTSVIGIICFYKILKRKLYILPKKLNEGISLSLSSMSFTFMLLSLMNNKINLGFLISNFVLVPIYSFLTLLGILSLIFLKLPIARDIISYTIIGCFSIVDILKSIFCNIFTISITFSYLEIIVMIIMLNFYFLYKNDSNKILKCGTICIGYIFLIRIVVFINI